MLAIRVKTLCLMVSLSGFIIGCATHLAYLPRSGDSHYWTKKAGFVTTGERSGTVEEMMDVIMADTLKSEGKAVVWSTVYDYVGGRGMSMLMAIPEEKESDGVRFVLIQYRDTRGLVKTTDYREIRGIKKEGNETFVWKQPLCIKDSNGKLSTFLTKIPCPPGVEDSFKEARAYYQQNKEKFSP